jgi:hypothetical protein
VVLVLGVVASAEAAAPPVSGSPKPWTGTIDPHRRDAKRKDIHGLALSRDGHTLVIAGGCKIAEWDLRTGNFVRERCWDDDDFVSDPTFVSGEKEVACVFMGDILILNRETLKTRLTIKKVPDQWSLLAASADGKRLAASTSRALTVWEAATGKVVWQRDFASANGLAFSPDGKLLAVAVDNKNVVLYDAGAGRQVGRLWNVERRFWWCGGDRPFSPDGRFIAMPQRGEGCSYVQLWDIAAGKLARLVQCKLEKDHAINSLAFSRDGKTLAAGYNHYLRVFELATGGVRHAAELSARHVAFCSGDRLVWTDAQEPQRVHVLRWREMGAAKPKRLTKDDLDRIWDDLGSKDAAVGHKAAAALLGSPRQAEILLARVPRLKPLTEKQIVRLIADLDDDDPDVRLRASEDLKHAGYRAEKALRAALAKPPSAEVKKRATAILKDLTPLRPERLRFLRAVEVLEAIGSPAARKQLKRLAGGAAGVEETEDAGAALERAHRR